MPWSSPPAWSLHGKWGRVEELGLHQLGRSWLFLLWIQLAERDHRFQNSGRANRGQIWWSNGSFKGKMRRYVTLYWDNSFKGKWEGMLRCIEITDGTHGRMVKYKRINGPHKMRNTASGQLAIKWEGISSFYFYNSGDWSLPTFLKSIALAIQSFKWPILHTDDANLSARTSE